VHCIRSVDSRRVKYSLTSDEDGCELLIKRLTQDSLPEPESKTQDADVAVTLSEPVKFANWVVVQFAGKKTSKFFVGQVVEDKDPDDVTVKFLKKSRSVFLWPSVEDISAVARSDVSRKHSHGLERVVPTGPITVFQLLIGLIQSRDNRGCHVLSSETMGLMPVFHSFLSAYANC